MGKKKKQNNTSKTKSARKVQNTNVNKVEKWREIGKSIINKIVIPILIPVIVNYIIFDSNKGKPSEIEQVKTRIAEVFPKLDFTYVKEDTVIMEKHPDMGIMIKVNESILQLVRLDGVHEVPEVKGTTIEESLSFTKANVLARNRYDNCALDVISVINDYFQCNPNSDEDLNLKKSTIEMMVSNWVDKDTIRNNELIRKIDYCLDPNTNSKNKSKEKKAVINTLTSFNKDLNHYIFKYNFYEYLFEIEKNCEIRVKEYQKKKTN